MAAMNLGPRSVSRMAVALLALLTGVGCRDTGMETATNGSPARAAAPGATTLPTAIEVTWPESPAPRSLVVARPDGIFEASVTTGRTIRRLTAIPRGYSPAWVRADRQHGRVFFGLESCDPEPAGTWVVPLAGGRPRFVTDGGEISVSPNGRLIAFPRIEDGCAAGALVVRDLMTGRERVWHPSTGDVASVAWAPDGHHIAFSSGLEQNVYLLDTAVPEEPDRRTTSAQPLFVESGVLRSAAVVGSRWLLLVDRQCPGDLPHGRPCEPSAQLIDGLNGRVLMTLPTLADWRPVALDDSGRAVLLGSTTDGAFARYGGGSVVTIGRAVAGDW